LNAFLAYFNADLFLKGDQFKQFKKQQSNSTNKLKVTSNKLCPSLSQTISLLKACIEDFNKFFLFKQDEVSFFLVTRYAK
jgi:hypothetical protein